MKKSVKSMKTIMSGGMLMNSSSSNDSNSDDDKCHLPTADSILSDNEKQNEEPIVVIRRNISRLRRQHATTSLQSPFSFRNISSIESIEHSDHLNDTDVILSEQTAIEKHNQTIENDQIDLNRTSFNESERTDSGIARDSGSSWGFSHYYDSFHSLQHHSGQQKQREHEQPNHQLDTQQEFDHDGDADENRTPVPQLNSFGRSSEDSFKNYKLKRAGWLHVKHWLTIQRHQKIDLASKRQWKRLWVCLKGSNLYFYNDYADSHSKFSISIIESLCYPLPEHPHRQHVFSLTTYTGDTYCFQASDQSEVDHWIRIVHCYSSPNRSVSDLKAKIKEFEEKIELELKMRKLGDLHLKSPTNQKVRLLISKQIDLWEKNLEAYHVDLFRNKCYLCALTNDRDLPNPKDLLAQACPSTKATLHKLSSFTPCSFYACVAARRSSDHSKWKLKTKGKSSSDEQETKYEKKCHLTSPRNPVTTLPSAPTFVEQTVLQMVTCEFNSQLRTIVSISEMATVGELLKRTTEKMGLQIDDHFLYFESSSRIGFVPDRKEKLSNLAYSSVEVRRKIVYQVTLQQDFNASGISIDTELHRECSLQVIVSDVRDNSIAERLGMRKGDEIVMINSFIVQDLDLNTFDGCLEQIPIVVTLRSSRCPTECAPSLDRSLDLSNASIQNLICPPPPKRIERISRQELQELIVPKPDIVLENNRINSQSNATKPSDPSTSALERLFRNVDELSRYCRPTSIVSGDEPEFMMNITQTPRVKPLSDAQRIRKVIFELIETERSYVQDMQRLLERYIEPLRDDSKLLPVDVIESLYVSVKSIHQLQLTFLQRLEANIPTEIVAYNAVHEFRIVLISLSETFLSYGPYFKLYSTFCAMHLRINRLLDLHQNNQHLKDFLAARNPRHQHSSSFESYLIKPVQRILKYPLLLQQMSIYSKNQNHEDSPLEVVKLKQAISMMNDIGEYMNGMQKLYEDFGLSFEQIIKIYHDVHNKSLQLNLPDLYAYGEIDWTNMHQFAVGKNHQRLKTYCFVFRHGCLLLVREQTAKKKQESVSSHKGIKIVSDRFMRFIPMEEITVNMIDNDNSKEKISSWQLIQIDSKTSERSYFRFTTKDAQTFVRTIDDCISSLTPTIEWRSRTKNRSVSAIRNSEPTCFSDTFSYEQGLSTSRSCHLLMSFNASSLADDVNVSGRSPSPVWKRRTTPVRRQPLSMHMRRKTIQNSTDC